LSLCSIISYSCQYSRSVWILVDEHFQTFEPLPRSESACAHPLAALEPALCILPRHGVVELAERLVNLHLDAHWLRQKKILTIVWGLLHQKHIHNIGLIYTT
jgi:hypothetical protein